MQRESAEQDRKDRIEALRGRALTDPKAYDELALADPGAALGIERARSARDERFSRERAHIAGRIENLPLEGKLKVLGESIEKSRRTGDDPAATQRLYDMLASGDPQQVAQAQTAIRNARMQGEREGHLKPAVPSKPGRQTNLELNLALLNDPSLTDEQREIVKANLMGSGQNITVNPDGSVSVVSGKGIGSGLQKRTKGDLEKTLVSAEQNISNLKRIEEQFDPEFLTYLGKGKAWTLGVLGKAGVKLNPEQTKYVGSRKKFAQNINRFFNQYRREITGAAASIMELNDLRKAMFSEDLSPQEFKASFDEFRNSVYRTHRVARKIYREGLSGDLRNKKSEAAQRFDEIYTSGGDDSALERINDLKGTMSEDEIFNTLKEEGYDF
jgi:hypothetical protein